MFQELFETWSAPTRILKKCFLWFRATGCEDCKRIPQLSKGTFVESSTKVKLTCVENSSPPTSSPAKTGLPKATPKASWRGKTAEKPRVR